MLTLNISLPFGQKSYVNLIALFVRSMYSVIHCRRLLVSLKRYSCDLSSVNVAGTTRSVNWYISP